MKRIRSEDEIYNVLEAALNDSDRPLTAPELMENPEVRSVAMDRFGHDVQTTTNKVSDTLGFMWRRGVLTRFMAPESPHYRARYCYAVTQATQEKLQEVPQPPSPSFSTKQRINIIEKDDKVVIELDNVTIIVRSK